MIETTSYRWTSPVPVFARSGIIGQVAERMTMRLAFSTDSGPATSPISPLLELGAYEALWLEEGASVKKIADRFAADPNALPSDFVSPAVARQRAQEVMTKLK